MLGKGNWEDNGYLKIINLEASDKLPPKGLMTEAMNGKMTLNWMPT